ncbi:MAG: hypothetical protein CL483_01075 [Acidobacteria bacterium]|nr:hypothetical protein [Acidobacteriota bacterium]|tara:strand:+ start:49 stop:531 length:483 start_codon:yes stop_codon:yes gene_type:complete
MRRPLFLLVTAVILLGPAARAHADLTLFVGTNTAQDNRPVRGFSAGLGLLVLGFEFEYADTAQDVEAGGPGLRTGMFNLLAQTPISLAGLQFYGTIGGGLYQERGAGLGGTNSGSNAGGGVKISVAGPLRLRVDYRVFSLRGSSTDSAYQRLYAGLNFAF